VFAQQHEPQLMVQTFVDEERMGTRTFQLYQNSDTVRRHCKPADPYS
jgi:hypothetical protein